MINFGKLSVFDDYIKFWYIGEATVIVFTISSYFLPLVSDQVVTLMSKYYFICSDDVVMLL